jgi:hypothetical protein
MINIAAVRIELRKSLQAQMGGGHTCFVYFYRPRLIMFFIFLLYVQLLWTYDALTNSAVRTIIGPRHVGDPGMYSYSSKRLSYVDCVPEHRLEKYIKQGRPMWD